MNLPKNIFGVASIMMILLLNCCDVDKLELVNPNQLTPETYFKSEAQVQMTVNAVYANLQTIGLYQRVLFYAMDGMSMEQMDNLFISWQRILLIIILMRIIMKLETTGKGVMPA